MKKLFPGFLGSFSGGLSRYQKKLRQARQLSLLEWGDFLRACVDLAIARVMLLTISPDQLMTRNGFSVAKKGTGYAPQDRVKRVERVAKAVALAARHVPWRSDCLIQALAARRRLNSSGLESELRLGVRKKIDGSLDAHAWLLQGEMTVTGGDVSEYNRLI